MPGLCSHSSFLHFKLILNLKSTIGAFCAWGLMQPQTRLMTPECGSKHYGVQDKVTWCAIPQQGKCLNKRKWKTKKQAFQRLRCAYLVGLPWPPCGVWGPTTILQYSHKLLVELPLVYTIFATKQYDVSCILYGEMFENHWLTIYK